MSEKMKAITHALKIIDNSMGDRDLLWIFAYKKDGIFIGADTDRPVLEYVGDEIVKVNHLEDCRCAELKHRVEELEEAIPYLRDYLTTLRILNKETGE